MDFDQDTASTQQAQPSNNEQFASAESYQRTDRETSNANAVSKDGSAFTVAVKYARLQGYLEGYLDQMAASKQSQEDLISKLLSELAEILNPLLAATRK